MESSPITEPMGKGERIARILHALTDRFTGDPMPTHYTPSVIPGVIGAVQLHLEMDRWEDESYRTE